MAGPPRPAPTIQDAISVNVIDGVHVTFGPGLQVQNVKTGFESRTVILKNIPSKKTSDDIKRLLSPFGDVSHVNRGRVWRRRAAGVQQPVDETVGRQSCLASIVISVAWGKWAVEEWRVN